MYSFINILHFLLIVQPIFFALQLLTYKNINTTANRFLGILMIFVSLFYIVNAPFVLEPLGILPYAPYFVYMLFLSINPFYYFYTRSLTVEDYQFNKKDLLHYLPSGIFLILSLIAYAGESKTIDSDLIKILATSVYNAQILIYAILMFILLKRHNINLKNYFSFSENINLNWLKIFLVIYVVISATDLIIFHLHQFELYQTFYFILMILFFNFLGYFGIKQTDIYATSITTPDSNTDEIEEEKAEEEKVSRSGLSEERKQKLMFDIIELMETNKMFLNCKLSIYDISTELGINKTYISNVINEHLQENFNNFINRYRINEAKKLLTDDAYHNLTIEGIANSVGFNSKASFNSAFKKMTGMTPSTYKSKNLTSN